MYRSKELKVLALLKRLKYVTHYTALRYAHTTELRKYVSNLRAKGYNIESVEIPRGPDATGRPPVKYRLVK